MIIEMLFYITMAALFSFNLLKYSDAFFITLSIAVVLSTHYYNAWVHRCFYWIPLLQFIPLFYCGILFNKMIAKNQKKWSNYLLVFFCLCCQLLLFNYSGRSRSFINFYEYAFMLSLFFIIFILFINEKLNFIVNKVTLFLGKISFALYLIHAKLSTAFIIPFLNNTLQVNFWISCAVALAVSISIAALITYLIEVPYSKKMRVKLYEIFKVKQTA
jgi:peptidoglycan/LPS O-acetylase OafA/YrhL